MSPAALSVPRSEPSTAMAIKATLLIRLIDLRLLPAPEQSLGLPGSLKNAFDHLTSRDPKKFWTSGQWMTERRGGSDVGACSKGRGKRLR